MNQFNKLLLIFFLTFSCSSDLFEDWEDFELFEAEESGRMISSFSEGLVIDDSTTKDELLRALYDRREQVKEWQLLCDGEFAGQASIQVECDQWDMIEFSGASCLAAQVSGDTETVQARCRDVELGQDENGRWWRGQKNHGTTKNSFSRDMMYGVISYFISQGILHPDKARRDEVLARALNWVDWIEYEGKGKQMCDDNEGAFSNSCQIKRSRILYHTLKKMGAINSANKDYKFFKRALKDDGLNAWEFETQFTPVGYPLFLKVQSNWQKYLMGVLNKDQYRKIAKIIYKKDPDNPWYEFFYVGPSNNNIKKTLERCPAERPTRDDWTVRHFATGDFQWQRATRDRAWEVASGHDCITLINWQIASLEGKIDIPYQKASGVCAGKELGKLNGKRICKPLIATPISQANCDGKNGLSWENGGKTYCIWDNGKNYKARVMKRVCPAGNKDIGVFDGLPLCEKKILNKIKLYRCNRKGMGEFIGSASHLVKDSNGNPTHCYVYRDTWYQKRKVGKFCPVGTKYEDELVSGWAPVCKSIKRISKDKCKKEGKYNVARDTYCLVRKQGWYSKRFYTKQCPFGKRPTGDSLDGKPYCKNWFHQKIRKNRCSKKGGTVNGKWCLWDKGDYYKVRQIR